MNATDILAAARAELDAERRRAAIDAAKDRLRTATTWRSRLAALLPFTVTIHWKKP